MAGRSLHRRKSTSAFSCGGVPLIYRPGLLPSLTRHLVFSCRSRRRHDGNDSDVSWPLWILDSHQSVPSSDSQPVSPPTQSTTPLPTTSTLSFSPRVFALPLENAPGSWTMALVLAFVCATVPGRGRNAFTVHAQIGSTIWIGPGFREPLRHFAPDLEGCLVATFRLNFY
jgi:hypothetical protein